MLALYLFFKVKKTSMSMKSSLGAFEDTGVLHLHLDLEILALYLHFEVAMNMNVL